MASLRRFPRSPYWYACFTQRDGSRVQCSTKEKNRKKAQAIADEFEVTARGAMQARQMQKVIAKLYQKSRGETLPQSTPEAFFAGWLARRKGELAPASLAAYSGRASHFLKWLGNTATRPLAELEKQHFVRYRDSLAERLAPTTANLGIKLLRVMLEDARRDGFIAENPAKDCGLLRKGSTVVRRPFSLDELRSVMAVASPEWRSLIMFGLYTGQRLGDLACLRWSQIDSVNEGIQFTATKTGRRVLLPLAAPLAAHVADLEGSDSPSAFVHPTAAAASNISTLSRQFSEILASCGLAEARGHQASKDGRGARRKASELSFHCLRHTATSIMKNAGISPAIVQDIIGHDSAEMSAHYTHVEDDAKRRALAAIPSIR